MIWQCPCCKKMFDVQVAQNFNVQINKVELEQSQLPSEQKAGN